MTHRGPFQPLLFCDSVGGTEPPIRRAQLCSPQGAAPSAPDAEPGSHCGQRRWLPRCARALRHVPSCHVSRGVARVATTCKGSKAGGGNRQLPRARAGATGSGRSLRSSHVCSHLARHQPQHPELTPPERATQAVRSSRSPGTVTRAGPALVVLSVISANRIRRRAATGTSADRGTLRRAAGGLCRSAGQTAARQLLAATGRGEKQSASPFPPPQHKFFLLLSWRHKKDQKVVGFKGV